MNMDPDGEVDLSPFAMESIKWLHDNDPEFFKVVSKAVLEDANKNLVRTGKVFNSFDLLREIIEKTEKKQLQRVIV